jgi:molybdate transport repressor ModE-like protein
LNVRDVGTGLLRPTPMSAERPSKWTRYVYVGSFPMAETQVSIRIDLERGGRPGKIALLEAISKTRSLTAAARSMNMSRMTAWLLVEEINTLLTEPAVTTKSGGTGGGGRATLTPVGQKLIQHKCAHEPPRAESFGLLVGWCTADCEAYRRSGLLPAGT